MCGICGLVDFQGNVSLDRVERMNATLTHRGPDDGGAYRSPDGLAGLASRRLSIIDLSAAGHQPMSNEDGSIWVAYNGEIYNFKELRRSLIAKGHQFASDTDTEVLVHLYEEKGDDLVHDLRGMFAFAIWDIPNQRLLIGRDRLGIKPLYFTNQEGIFLFASEVKGLFASGAITPSLNHENLIQYLALGYLPHPETLFKGIQKLSPGHILIVDQQGFQIQPYWDIFDQVEKLQNSSEDAYIDGILDHLGEAVNMRLVADVPVGIFLSGGIDSSLIAALAARHSHHPIKTFTLGFKGHPEYNELVHARRVAQFLGAQQHEILIDAGDIQQALPSLQPHFEEPIMNPIWFAIYFVSRLARDHGVIVMLSGDGGDELYAGYNRWMDYLRLYRSGLKSLSRLPAFAKTGILGTAKKMIPSAAQNEILRRGLSGEELYWGHTVFKADQVRSILSPGLRPSGSLWDNLPLSAWQETFSKQGTSHAGDPLDWMTYTSLKGFLLEDYLARLDKMGMAASIEARVPMLDHQFLAFSLSLPNQAKYPGFQNKYLLRQAAMRLLPKDIIDRPKVGFCAPVESWLMEAFSSDLLDGLTLLQEREKVFDTGWFKKSVSAIHKDKDLSAPDWALLSLGQWYAHWCAA